jgi:hypothetical protein
MWDGCDASLWSVWAVYFVVAVYIYLMWWLVGRQPFLPLGELNCRVLYTCPFLDAFIFGLSAHGYVYIVVSGLLIMVSENTMCELFVCLYLHA